MDMGSSCTEMARFMKDSVKLECEMERGLILTWMGVITKDSGIVGRRKE